MDRSERKGGDWSMVIVISVIIDMVTNTKMNMIFLMMWIVMMRPLSMMMMIKFMVALTTIFILSMMLVMMMMMVVSMMMANVTWILTISTVTI